jgi:hypothetical protein
MAQLLPALAYLAPALAILMALASRRYPGERALVAASGRDAPAHPGSLLADAPRVRSFPVAGV